MSQLRDNVMKLRMVPISRLFAKYQRTVRELSHKLGKEVAVDLVGEETELDKVLVERLEDPLLHLVRNSVDHGVELPEVRERAGKPRQGTVRLVAAQRGGQVIEHRGRRRGLDAEKLRKKAVEKGLIDRLQADALSESECHDPIFRAGFSTAAQVSDVSGRGVGMDVVRDAVHKLKGSVHVESILGRGTRIDLRPSLTLAITQILAARVGAEHVAIPLDAVVSTQSLADQRLEAVADGTCLRFGGKLVPILDLARLLGLPESTTLHEHEASAVVIVEVDGDRLGLLVQQVIGRHEVGIKSLGPVLAGTLRGRSDPGRKSGADRGGPDRRGAALAAARGASRTDREGCGGSCRAAGAHPGRRGQRRGAGGDPPGAGGRGVRGPRGPGRPGGAGSGHERGLRRREHGRDDAAHGRLRPHPRAPQEPPDRPHPGGHGDRQGLPRRRAARARRRGEPVPDQALGCRGSGARHRGSAAPRRTVAGPSLPGVSC
ncbi:MAG: chemotaxis protein CheW [Comamonadaceae bacterium]|nr:chemotaxis protein CheW [Comamonadaceae bacterium]